MTRENDQEERREENELLRSIKGFHQRVQDNKRNTETLKDASNLATHSSLKVSRAVNILLSECKKSGVGDDFASASNEGGIRTVQEVSKRG